MTGEVTLRGRVLAIGGLKEKPWPPCESGVHTVLVPRENVKDLDEIDQTVRAGLHFIPVDTVDQVFAAALVHFRGEHAAPGAGRRRRPRGAVLCKGGTLAMPINYNKAEFIRSAVRPDAFIRDGRPQVTFAGRSNVGKSSVINRLLNRKNFARVGATPRQNHPGELLSHRQPRLSDGPARLRLRQGQQGRSGTAGDG